MQDVHRSVSVHRQEDHPVQNRGGDCVPVQVAQEVMEDLPRASLQSEGPLIGLRCAEVFRELSDEADGERLGHKEAGDRPRRHRLNMAGHGGEWAENGR